MLYPTELGILDHRDVHEWLWHRKLLVCSGVGCAGSGSAGFASAAVGTELHFEPVAGPGFAPGHRALAVRAGFAGQGLLVAAVAFVGWHGEHLGRVGSRGECRASLLRSDLFGESNRCAVHWLRADAIPYAARDAPLEALLAMVCRGPVCLDARVFLDGRRCTATLRRLVRRASFWRRWALVRRRAFGWR